MIIELTYQLSGYIPYTNSNFGFVTPVFTDNKGKFYIQVSSGHNQLPTWNPLPESYYEVILRIDYKSILTDSFIYGFKRGDELYFAKGKEMAYFLSTSFSTEDEEGYDLAKGFIEDWPLLEPIIESLNKDEIWNKCLDIISKQSKAMPAIFKVHFEVQDFNDGKLVLKSSSDNARKIFQVKFKESLENHFDKIITNFKIEFITESDDVLPASPFVYYGGGPLQVQGSYFLETGISPFQDFDNFVVSEFNTIAYHQALDFTNRKTASILAIQGAIGVGKTHLVHSIAKRLISSHKNVGIYTVFSQPGQIQEICEPQIKQFEEAAYEKDLIIIDDAHNLKRENSSWVRLVRLLKKWKAMNKSIILSYRENYQMDIVPELQDNVDRLYLSLPDEADKLSIIESRASNLNIELSEKDLIKLAGDKEINIADIQKVLARTYLMEEIRNKDQKMVFSFNIEHIHPKVIDSCVYHYLNYNFIPHFYNLESSGIHAKVISHFIQDILITPHHGANLNSRLPYIDGLYYSFDTLQYYVFENEEFRKMVSDILMQLVSNNDNQSNIDIT